MKIRLLGLLLLLIALPLAAAETFAVNGRKVTVTTKRYIVEFDGLTMTTIENRLTGETYAKANAKPPFGGVTIESVRPGIRNKTYRLSDRSQLTVKKREDGVSLVYRGLLNRYGVHHGVQHFDKGLTMTLSLSVDPKTEDLLIQPAVTAEIEKVIGVRDRGVLDCGVGFAGLSEDLRLIIPASDGFSVTKDDTPPDWKYSNRWPQGWEAALLIAESKQGCLGLWADEPELRYGRLFQLHRDAGWNLRLYFETADRIENCTTIKGAVWRFNVFRGYWAKAAERYVQQMEKQWPDMKPLAATKPAWADKIRIVTMPTPSPQSGEQYARLVPRDTIAVFTCQEWMVGWNDGQIRKQTGGPMDYFPNWPLDNPTHYEGWDNVTERWPKLQELGFHIFPYTNPTIITHVHPWIRKKIGPKKYFGFRVWQRMYPELCQPIVERYKVSGIYEDCSWVVRRHVLGEPDGENWYNGGVRMRQYFKKLMPDIAVMGERNNEVTARGQQFALSLTQWPNHAHPINAYIFGKSLRMWNINQAPRGFDADDIRGWMTKWPAGYEKDPIQERLMLRKRGVTFAKEQLKSHWPETWDPDVMHYFKSKDGVEHRFVRRNGTRFVRITPQGEELIYWRLHGVTGAVVGNAGVEGWLGYNGDRIIGLNPKGVYITITDVKRAPVTIASVPEGYCIRRCLVRDGFWLATFAKLNAKEGQKPETVKVKVRSTGKKVSFSGATAVKDLGRGEYEVELESDAGLVAYWRRPAELDFNMMLTDVPAVNTIARRGTGIISQYSNRHHKGNSINQFDGEPDADEEGNLPYLVKIPEFGLDLDGQPFLVFQYGTDHGYGDGANYMVRVNGQQRWKRYRPQVAKADGTGKPTAPPLKTGAVNLKAFVGKVVVLELAVDGNRTGVSETIRWTKPMIQSSAPQTAETDDDQGAPDLGGPDGLLE